MRDVPDETVVGGVENVVEGDGKFDDAKRGAKVAAGVGDGAEDVPAEFVDEFLEIIEGETLEVVGGADRVEQGGGAWAFVFWLGGWCGGAI